MAIPTLPAQTGYTLRVSVASVNFFIGVYKNDSAFSYRVVTYSNDGNLTELDAYDGTYTGTYAQYHSPNDALVDDQDALWVAHGNYGLVGYTFDGSGVITETSWVSNGAYTVGNNDYNNVYKAGDRLFGVCRENGFRVFEVTAPGVASNTPTYTYVQTYNINKMRVFQNNADDKSLIIVQQENGTAKHWFEFDHLTNVITGPTTDNSIPDSFSIPYTDDFDGDRRYSRKNRITYSRQSTTRFLHINDDFTYETVEMFDPTSTTALEDLIIQKEANIKYWYDCDDYSNNYVMDKISDQDLPLANTFTFEDNFIQSELDANRKCLAISGNGTAELYSGNSVDLGTSNQWTIELWVQIDQAPVISTLKKSFFTLAGTVSTSYYIGQYIDSQTTGIGCNYYTTERVTIPGTYGVAENGIYHIVHRFDSTIGQELYVNGVLTGTNSDLLNVLDGNTYPAINQFPHGENEGHNFKISNIVVYDEVWLTDSEIVDHYKAGLSVTDLYAEGTYKRQILDLNPVAYYPCDDASQSVIDITGNGHNLKSATGGVSFNQLGYVEDATAIRTAGTSNRLQSGLTLLDSATELTIEVWINVAETNVASDGNNVYFRLDNTTNGNNINQTFFQYSSNRFYAISRIATPTSNTNGTLPNKLKLGSWNHIVLTSNVGTGLVNLYLNGILELESLLDPTASQISNPVSFALGSNTTLSTDVRGFFTDALYQHAAVYDFELSAEQVESNYNLGLSSNGSYSAPTAENAYEQSILDDNPIVYFPMNESSGPVINDKMGRSKGTFVNGSAESQSVPGYNQEDLNQNWIQFDGVNQHILIDDISVLGHYDQFSAEALVRFNATNTRMEVFSSNLGAGGGFGLWSEPSLNCFSANVYSSANNAFNTALGSQSGFTPYASTHIYHVAMSFDGTILRLYVNGQLVGENNIVTSGYVTYSASSTFRLGSNPDSGRYLNGQMAHFAMFDTALSAERFQDRAKFLLGLHENNFNTNSIRQAIWDSSPYVYYPMDTIDVSNRMLYDVKSFKHTQNATGTFTANSFGQDFMPNGEDTKAYHFVGTQSDYINLDFLQSDLFTNNSGDYSIEFWFKHTPSGNSEQQNDTLVSMHLSDGTNVMIIGPNPIQTTGLFVNLNNATATSRTDGIIYDDEDLNHIVININGSSSNIKIYSNSIMVLEYVGTLSLSTATRLSIGQEYDGSVTGDFITADIGHLAFYNRLLTESEIVDHFKTSIGYSSPSDYSYKTLIKSDNPSFYYTGDRVESNGTVIDESGNENHAHDYFNNLSTTSGIIDEGESFNFQSEGRMIRLDHEWLNIGQGDWSFECWLEILGPSYGGSPIIFTNYGTTGGYSGAAFVFHYDHPSYPGYFSFWVSAIASPVLVSTVTTAPNIRRHIVLTRSGGSIKLYIDGLLDSSYSGTSGNFNFVAFDSLDIGNSRDKTPGHHGNMDEIAFYEYELTHSQISEHYLKGVSYNTNLTSSNYFNNVIAKNPTMFITCDSKDYVYDFASQIVVGKSDSKPIEVNGNTIGGFDNILEFDGVNNRIQLITDAPKVLATEPWSIEGWYSLEDISFPARIQPFSISSAANASGWAFDILYSSNGVFSFRFYIRTVGPTNEIDVTTNSTFPTDVKALHLVVTYDGTLSASGIKLYVNGKDRSLSTTTDTLSSNVDYADDYTFIGYKNSGSGNPALNDGDHFGRIRIGPQVIYNYELLSSEVSELYFSGLYPNDTRYNYLQKLMPIAYWPFDDDTGTPEEYAINGVIPRQSDFWEPKYITENTARPNGFPLTKYSTSSIFLDGTDPNGLNFETDLSLQVSSNSPFSISMWLIALSKPAAGDVSVAIHEGGRNNSWDIGFGSDSTFGVYTKSSDSRKIATIPVEEFPIGIPVHVIGQFSTTEIQLFLNGKMVASFVGSGITANGSDLGAIGNGRGGGAARAELVVPTGEDVWHGYIDDVSFSNDVWHTEQSATDVFNDTVLRSLLTEYESTITSLTPVLWYRFDSAYSGGIYDTMNNIRAYNDDVTYTDTVPTFNDGFVNSGFTFNGTTDAFTIDDSDISFVNTTTNYSASFWIKPTSGTSGRVISKEFDQSDKELGLSVGSDGTIGFLQEVGGNNAPAVVTVETINFDEWNHVVLVIDSSNNATIYINNSVTSVNNTAMTAAPTRSSEPLGIGKATGAQYQNQFFTGDIDEIIWFNRPINALDVETIYNSTNVQYRLSGTVKEDGVPASRLIRIHRRSDGKLMKELYSTGGNFELLFREYDPDEEYYIIAFDDDVNPFLEAIIHDKVPVEVVS